MTYRRFKRALEQIVAGAPDPVAVATEALRSRVIPAKPKPPETANTLWRDLRLARYAFFEEWLKAGRPTYRAYAKTVNRSAGFVGQRLQRAAREIAHTRTHHLHVEACKFLGWEPRQMIKYLDVRDEALK